MSAKLCQANNLLSFLETTYEGLVWYQIWELKLVSIKSEVGWVFFTFPLYAFKDTHREKAPSNKTPTLSKSMSMDIGVVATSNQLFRRGS